VQYRLPPSSPNPFAQALAAVVGVLLVVGALFLGLVVGAVVLGLVLLAWIGFRLRLWWLRRRMGVAPQEQGQAQGKGQVIDADYEVVSRREDD
jgi:hypothetical protein